MLLLRSGITFKSVCLFTVGAMSLCGGLAAAQAGQWQGTRISNGGGLSTTVAPRTWIPRDSVALQNFETEQVIPSPDGQRFFFVTSHGDLECDCDRYEMSIYSVHDIARAIEAGGRSRIKPINILYRRSFGSETAAIWDPQWDMDSRSISFWGLDEKGIFQAYRYNVETSAVRKLTDSKNRVRSYTIGSKTVISEQYVNVAPKSWYPYRAVSAADLRSAIIGDSNLPELKTYVSYLGGRPWPVNLGSAAAGFRPWFSSDGDKAVQVRTGVAGRVSGANSEDRPSGQSQSYALIDAKGQQQRIIADIAVQSSTSSPIRPQAFWVEDSQRVVLVNVNLASGRAASSEASNTTSYIASYDCTSGQWEPLEPLERRVDGALRKVVQVGWLIEGRELLVRHELNGQPDEGTVYRLEGDRWEARSAPKAQALPRKATPSLGAGVTVQLRQDENSPAVMVASTKLGRLDLTKSDPALEGIWWARSEQFEYQLPDGKVLQAGLMLPRNPGARIPLVIQAYQYDPKLFQPDGMFQHTYAAQSLVSRGIAVLNITIPSMDDRAINGTVSELREFTRRVRAAVDKLDKMSIIDPSRVGLIGFSRAGFNIYYLITHPDKDWHPAAVVIEDSFPGSFGYYLTSQAMFPGPDEYGKLYGGDFWHNKDSWLESETTFNVDKVESAVLLADHGQQEAVYGLETVGAFATNRKVLEYIIYPDTRHQLHKPRQRLAGFELNVDWMSYWLLNVEDGAAEKRDQYARWRAMRRNWHQKERPTG